MIRTAVPALLLLATAGCIPGYVDQGVNKKVAVYADEGGNALAVGETMQVFVGPERRTYGLFEVTRGPSHDLAHVDVGAPVVAIDDAHCDDDACSVGEAHPDPTFPDGMDFTVTALKPGPTTLHVSARTSGGKVLPGTAPLGFAALTDLWVGPKASIVSDQRGGAEAVLAGTEIFWNVEGGSGRDANGDRVAVSITDLNVSVTGDAASAEVTEAPDGALDGRKQGVVTVHALRAGDAVIHLVSGAASRDVPLHVEYAQLATALEVYAVVPVRDHLDDIADPRLSPDALSAVHVVGVASDLALVLRFADGWLAVGEIRQLHVDRYQVAPQASDGENETSLEGEAGFALGLFQVWDQAEPAGPAVLTAQLGGATLSVDITD